MSKNKKYIVRLSDDDVQRLRSTLKKKDTNETVANRCRILLDVDENHSPVLTQMQTAKEHGTCRSTVSNTVKNFCINGLESVLTLNRNENSNNARRKLDGRGEARLIAMACGTAPEGHSRWTIRLLERESKIVLDEPVSRETIRRTLKKTNFNLIETSIGAFRQKQMPNL